MKKLVLLLVVFLTISMAGMAQGVLVHTDTALVWNTSSVDTLFWKWHRLRYSNTADPVQLEVEIVLIEEHHSAEGIRSRVHREYVERLKEGDSIQSPYTLGWFLYSSAEFQIHNGGKAWMDTLTKWKVINNKNRLVK